MSFMGAGNDSTPILIPENLVKWNFVLLSYSLENGESNRMLLAPTTGEPGAAAVTGRYGCAHGVSGEWRGTGASFTVAEESGVTLANVVTVTLDDPQHVLPYICTVVNPDDTLKSSPLMGWEVQLPEANATASFSFTSSKSSRDLTFSGIGFHEHFWSDGPFQQRTKTQYMGHIRLGPNSIVWHLTSTLEGETYSQNCDRLGEQKLWTIESNRKSTSIIIRLQDGTVAEEEVQKSQQNWPTPNAQYTGKASAAFGDVNYEGVALFYEYHAPIAYETPEERFLDEWNVLGTGMELRGKGLS
ncbi:hypothetical protein BCR34DRAFT_592557 [Clohesyomyces aquaticus]|uniref:Uncharacterized protein n=1 Tax=Clohesyomyces aquaticus TaxID=1231657 RepID=A0A1Y1YQZ3_9PLEO|nr:hypothetical protein BCR34DRAFT_592557 [Clohesyomyces aquaticus]